MYHPTVSYKRAKTLSTAVFLISLAVISYTNRWWPEILLAFGISLAFRQVLLGRAYDSFLSLVIFVGAYIGVTYEVSFEVLLPAMFLIAGLYLLIREFFSTKSAPEAEAEESLNKEIEEDQE